MSICFFSAQKLHSQNPEDHSADSSPHILKTPKRYELAMLSRGTGVLETSLDCTIRKSGTSVERIVIGLHGYGDCAKNFSGLHGEIPVPNTLWVFPNAPYQAPFAAEGRQWYELYAPAQQQIAQSSAAVAHLIQQLMLASGFDSKQIALMGFSQGGFLSMHTGLRFAQPLGAVVSLSGYLAQTHRLGTLSEVAKSTPFFVAHGMHDNLVLPSQYFEAVDALSYLGVKTLETRTYPCAHSLHPGECKDLAEFILKHVTLNN